MINNNFWKGKKVLVTGHTGFKGGWLSLWMKILGAEVAGYSLDPITKKNFFDLTRLKKIFKLDCRNNIQNFNSLKNCIENFKPEVIFHLAAQPQVLQSYSEPLDTVRTNVIGTVNLLEISRSKKFIKSIIIVTTDKVYKNKEKKIRFCEEDSLGGDDLYSSSKACADIISLSYSKSFHNNIFFKLATARAGNCIGGGDWTKYRILTDSSEAFLKDKKLIIRNPNSQRPWQHVLEPLAGYIILAQKLYTKSGLNFCGAWNFGPSRKNHITVKKFAEVFKEKMKSSSKIYLKKNSDKKEKLFLDLDSFKSKKKLNWKSFLSINQTLQLTAEWYLAHKQKKDMFKVSFDQIIEFMRISKKI
jgi:CDP-glucose 4,6-dehydratase